MTYEELKKSLVALQERCDVKKSELRKQYAIEHNPVKFGDIITDHYHTIRVEQMFVYCYDVPEMKYTGTEMTKYGEPKKHQPTPRNPVFQENIVSINGLPYEFEKK